MPASGIGPVLPGQIPPLFAVRFILSLDKRNLRPCVVNIALDAQPYIEAAHEPEGKAAGQHGVDKKRRQHADAGIFTSLNLRGRLGMKIVEEVGVKTLCLQSGVRTVEVLPL